MVWFSQFFFAHITRVHKSYKQFFEHQDQDNKNDEADNEDSSYTPASQNTARFYFGLTYKLAKEDITKFEEIDNLSVYLCLNTASLIKDQVIKEQNEIKRLKAEARKIK